MPYRYQDIYPSEPLLDSSRLTRPSAAELLHLEYFEAAADEMPTEVFDQHHILLNLRETPHRVENFRDGTHRDFLFRKDEVIVTPAGVRSGWRWHSRSKVIVITLEPVALERFALSEVGVLLTSKQLHDRPLFTDPDLCMAGVLLKDALERRALGFHVLFESLARIFLVKLIRRYGETQDDTPSFVGGFGVSHYQLVFDYIARNYRETIAVEDLAREVGLSPSHFSRLFKQTIGQTPHQFVLNYRIEQSRKLLADPQRTLIDIALGCGFADQAHFARVFKQIVGKTPKEYRASLS